jgi:Protein of unknown function (DUF1524)
VKENWPLRIFVVAAAGLFVACTSSSGGRFEVTISTSAEISNPRAHTPPNVLPTTPPTTSAQDRGGYSPSDAAAIALDQLAELPVPSSELTPPYDRSASFGGWRDVDGDCQDTRAEVLIAESQVPVIFSDASSNCRVTAGRWQDVYTERVVSSAGELDIDHLVPLYEAWTAGAWRWTQQLRVAFANDLEHPEQLVAVTPSANRSKGSRAPDAWKPPSDHARCEYALSWISIKARWRLSVHDAERTALVDMLRICQAS